MSQSSEEPQHPVVIVSGFRPFQDGTTNPSLEVARRYAENVRRRWGFHTVEVTLDVLWDADQRTVRGVIERTQRQWPHRAVEWIAFGQGHTTAMETVARNRREPVADNHGRVPGHAPGDPAPENDAHGPEQYLSDPVDVRRIMEGLMDRGMNVSESTEAGGFLCECILYELLQQVQRGRLQHGRFFHVPTTEHMAESDPEKVRIETERVRFVDALSELTALAERSDT